MDVYCATCREPWDSYYLRHELGESGTALREEGWRFGASRLAVLHCPACRSADTEIKRGAQTRRRNLAAVADLCGDDEDALEAMLDDMADE